MHPQQHPQPGYYPPTGHYPPAVRPANPLEFAQDDDDRPARRRPIPAPAGMGPVLTYLVNAAAVATGVVVGGLVLFFIAKWYLTSLVRETVQDVEQRMKDRPAFKADVPKFPRE